MIRVLKKYLLTISGSFLLLVITVAHADNLMQVYQSALYNDQTFKQAYYQLKVSSESSPQALSALLPDLQGTVSGAYGGTDEKVAQTDSDGVFRTSAYGLTLSQPIFDYAAFSDLAAAHVAVKSAYATYAYAQQDLISRTIDAYLQILQDQDLLRYAHAAEETYNALYQQANERFKVGTGTKIDIYTTKSSYDESVSDYIDAQNALSSDLEALTVITNQAYQELTPLSEKIPLITPKPATIQNWVRATEAHNWNIAAAKYTVQSDKDSIRAARGGHLPSLALDGSFSNNYQHFNHGGDNTRTIDKSIGLTLTVPILGNGVYGAGYISSTVRQAIAQYGLDAAALQSTYRNEVQNARSSYLAVNYAIGQIKANRNTITSDKLALKSVEEGYRVGTESMTDVLTQAQKLYTDLNGYATSRYNYLDQMIALKLAAGTLSEQEVNYINSYLSSSNPKQAIDYVGNAASFVNAPTATTMPVKTKTKQKQQLKLSSPKNKNTGKK